MTKDELNNRYFHWMCSKVCDERYFKTLSYEKLLRYLNDVDFDYIIDMDGNRAEDGTDLRYRFAYENDYDGRLIAAYLDDHPCSILEMMIALALRCEEHIMSDPDVGDRTGQWFWNMIVSLGLGNMTNTKFDVEYVDYVIDRFLYRKYERNGRGGLFIVENTNKDLRTIEIWYQMCLYLDNVIH